MKNRIVYFCLGILLVTIILLCVYIAKHELVCNRIHLEDIAKTKNMVPDEETAKKIADIIIDRHFKLEEDFIYHVTIHYDEKNKEWEVAYHPTTEEGGYVMDTGRTVWIRKDDGMITGWN